MTTHVRLIATDPAAVGFVAASFVTTAIRAPVTLPAITPTTWELKLPDYPVISNSWRSASFPELLGSLPSDSEWSLRFENVTAAEALALMLPWRATGGGQWPLTALPEQLAGGVDDAVFRRRLMATTWTMARPPQKESVKKGRFNVTIELVYELAFDSLYGLRNPPAFEENPLRLKLPSTLAIAGVPLTFEKVVDSREASGVLGLELEDELLIVGANAVIDRTPRRDAADSLVIGLSSELTPIAVPVSFVKTVDSRSAQGPLVTGLEFGLTPAGTVP